MNEAACGCFCCRRPRRRARWPRCSTWRTNTGPVLVEDPFGSVDGSVIGLTPRQLPVMIRRPGAAVPATNAQVARVVTADQLALAERIVVDGFPLETFGPYRTAEAFPTAMLEQPGVEFYIINHDGAPAGACVTVVADGVGGIYWVTTLPEFRSHGVGRDLMHAVLAEHAGLMITLTASRAGRPLYDSLGFMTITPSTWWA